MGQPVRNIIKEQHPEINVEPIYTLLIDGNNLLRRSFTEAKYNSKGEDYGAIVNFFVQLKIMLKKKIYDYIYCFFDEEGSGILRYEIYSDYKSNRDKKYFDMKYQSDYGRQYAETLRRMQEAIFNKNSKKKREKTDKQRWIDENFERERAIIMEMFNELFIRWMMDEKTEGDDLIAYYVLHKKPEEKIVIWSTDEDYAQLIGDDVIIYNQNDKEFITKYNFRIKRGYIPENTVIKKIMCGDTSDNIKNITGLSEARLMELMPEMRDKKITVDDVKEKARLMCEERKKDGKKPLKWHENIINGVCNGNYDGDFYTINSFLVDLKHPLLTDEAESELKDMMYNVQDPEGRSFENLYKIILDNDITEFANSNSFSTFFNEFKLYADKEKSRFLKKC